MAALSKDAVAKIGHGAWRCEGVVVDKDGNAYGGGRNGVIYKVDPDGKAEEVCRLPAGSEPNGVTMDRQGNIVYCDLAKHAVMRVSLAGHVSMVADRIGDVVLTTPNFATYDADGNLFVSNSTSHLNFQMAAERGEYSNPTPNGALVRIRANGKSDVVATGLCLANGTAIDPNEEAVFVLQSTQRDCLRIAIQSDGTFGKPEIYSRDFPGAPDGMAFAADGTLFVTIPCIIQNNGYVAANKIIQVDPDGHWSLFFDDAEAGRISFPTNCAFGGPLLQDLFIANLEADHFSRIRTSFVGHRLYHQR
jgi:sugar lactone lactonase YvrE